MKIGIDINELTLKQETGVKVYTREIVRALSQIDQKNEYILYYNCKDDVNCVIMNENSKFKIQNSKFNFPFWTYTKLPQEIKKDKPDLLFMPIQAVPFFRKPKNIKIVVAVHDLAFMIFPEYFTAKDKFLLNFHTKRAIQMADAIIAPSEATKKDIIKFYKIDQSKIKVIYHGVNIPTTVSSNLHTTVGSTLHTTVGSTLLSGALCESGKYIMKITKDSTQEYEANDKKNNFQFPYLLFVGQIQPRKNIIRLIEVFEIVKSRRDEALPRSYIAISRLKLVIVGGKGWMADKIYEKAKKSKFSEDIVLTGKVNNKDLARLYQNALMFVFPSLYEGFGLPVLEAMSYGVPCIVSDNSSLSEIADNYALLVNAHDSDDIAQKINSFLNNNFLREDFAQRSLKNVKRFSWEQTAKKTLEVFM